MQRRYCFINLAFSWFSLYIKGHFKRRHYIHITWRLRNLSLDSSPPIESSNVEWDSSKISVFPSLLNVSSRRSILTDWLLDFLWSMLVPVNVSSNVSIWRSLRSLPDLRYSKKKRRRYTFSRHVTNNDYHNEEFHKESANHAIKLSNYQIFQINVNIAWMILFIK